VRTTRITLLLEEHAALCDDDGHIAVYVAFTMLVEEGYGDVGVGYALDEWYAKDAWDYRVFCVKCVSGGMGAQPTRAGLPRSSSFLAARLLKVLHHEVKSRRAEAGSDAAMEAGWGSPLRRRGVWGFCRAAGMAAVGACGPGEGRRRRRRSGAAMGRGGDASAKWRERAGAQGEGSESAARVVVVVVVAWCWRWWWCEQWWWLGAVRWSQAALLAATRWAGQEHGG
jgi:hypothetical protein